MKLRKIVCLIVLFSALTGTSMAADWELIYNKEGISGFERTIPGTGIKEFKAYGFVEARMEVIGELLRDIPSYPQWMASCKATKVLADIDRNTKIFFNETAAPWPVPNRGIIITNTTQYQLDTGRAVIRFKALNSPKYPIRKGLVPVTDLDGEYLLEFFGRDMTKVTYRHRAHPGGNVPLRVANYQSRFFPVINIKGMRKMVRLDKYKNLGAACEEYRLIENMVKDPAAVKTISVNRLGEYFYKQEDISRIFRSGGVVDRVIRSGADHESIRYMVIDACKVLINDPEVRAKYGNKSLREAVNVDRFYNDRVLTAMFAKDAQLISLVLNDRDLLRKVMSDRILLGKIIDSQSLAKSIANDQALVNRLAADEEFIAGLKANSRLFQSPGELKKIIETRIAKYKNVA